MSWRRGDLGRLHIWSWFGVHSCKEAMEDSASIFKGASESGFVGGEDSSRTLVLGFQVHPRTLLTP